MVLLSSDDVDGECSITTANLDGETNLKVSAAASKVASYVCVSCCYVRHHCVKGMLLDITLV